MTHHDLRRTAALIELLAPERLAHVVDIGANLLEDEPPYAPLVRAGLCEVTGFEPQDEALERLRAAASPAERYLPDAVGDGDEHTLYMCAWQGFSSLFQPDPEQLELLTDFPKMAEVVSTERVATVRLDDVRDLGPADHLKMDVQGAELMILEHAHRVLGGLTSIQVEASFHRLYRGQPTFSELDLALRARGFVPQSFVSVKDWPLAPVQWADPLQESSRQLVEADILYVRDLGQWDAIEDDRLRHLAVICDGAFDQRGIAIRALRELARRGCLAGTAVDTYCAL